MKRLILIAALLCVSMLGCGDSQQSKLEKARGNAFSLTKLTADIAMEHYTCAEYFEILNGKIKSSKPENKKMFEELPLEVLDMEKFAEKEFVAFEMVTGDKLKKFSDKFGPVMFNGIFIVHVKKDDISTLDTTKIYRLENFKSLKLDTEKQEIKYNWHYVDFGMVFCAKETTIVPY